MSEKQNLTLGRQSSKYLLLPVVIACAALLASCGGGSDSTSTAESADGTKEALAVSGAAVVPPGWTGRAPKMEVINGIIVPPEPAPSINNATLAGVDVNSNGVRDDIERKIAITATDINSYTKTLALSRNYQQKILMPINNTRAAALIIVKNEICLSKQSGSIPNSMRSYAGKEGILELNANTIDRQDALTRFNALIGAVSRDEVNCD